MSKKYIVKSGERYLGEDMLFHTSKLKAKRFLSKRFPMSLIDGKRGDTLIIRNKDGGRIWWNAIVIEE